MLVPDASGFEHALLVGSDDKLLGVGDVEGAKIN